MRQFESVRDFCSVGKEKVKYSAIAECEIIHFVNCEISHAAFGSVRCEMKFAHIRVSEYFTFAEQIFHSEAISLAQRANFTEKSHSLLRMAFFLCCHYKIDPYKATVQKQSIIFAMRVGLPLGDDGRQK